jgi:hypothetical protein
VHGKRTGTIDIHFGEDIAGLTNRHLIEKGLKILCTGNISFNYQTRFLATVKQARKGEQGDEY